MRTYRNQNYVLYSAHYAIPVVLPLGRLGRNHPALALSAPSAPVARAPYVVTPVHDRRKEPPPRSSLALAAHSPPGDMPVPSPDGYQGVAVSLENFPPGFLTWLIRV